MIVKLSLWQKIKLKIFEDVFVGFEMRRGWTKPNKIYAAKCRTHGLYFGMRHGWNDSSPQCPSCMEELTAKVLFPNQKV